MSVTLAALAFGIGVVAGLRSLTAPAVVSWAAHLGWLKFYNAHLTLLRSTPVVWILTAFALSEFVADKLPTTPNRTAPAPLIGRIATGALCGAALAAAGGQALLLGILLGSLGGIAGAFGGYEARHELVHGVHLPDLLVAVSEDLIAIGGALLIVTRLR
jgi:uncharacterized membrane protein